MMATQSVTSRMPPRAARSVPVRTLAERNRAATWIASDLATLHEPGYGTAGTFRTSYVDDLVMVADDIELTVAERALMARGREDCVRANRIAFQYVTYPLFVTMIEQATDRQVLSFSSEVHLEVLCEMAIFRLAPDPPVRNLPLRRGG